MKKLLSFKKERSVIFLLLIWVFALSFAYSLLSITRHNHFESGGFDLGIYDQGVWLYAHLHFPFSTIKERVLLGDHLTLTLPFLVPLFYVWDSVKVLLIFQAFWLAFSSIGIYKIAVVRKLPLYACLVISIVYSVFYGIQFAVFFDFHPVIIAAGLLPWFAYFLERGKKRLFLLTLTVIVLTQENMGLAISCLAIIYLFKKQYRRVAFAMLVFGLLISLISLKIVGSFSPVGYEYSPVINNFSSLITGFFDHPDKITVWFYSLSSFLFLPILSPGSILATGLDLSQYFVTGQTLARMWSPFTHHRVILATILALGTIDAFSYLQKRKVNVFYITIIFLFFALFQQYFFHFPLNKLSKPIYYKHYSWMDDTEFIVRNVPEDASVAAQQSLVPHLSHRKQIYLIWPRQSSDKKKCLTQKSCWWLDFGGKPTYLVVDTHLGSSLTQLLESRENFASALENMQKAGKISLYKSKNAAQIYKVNY